MKHTAFRMNRFCALLLSLVLLCTLLPANASAANDTPVIALTYIPAYGSTESFEGKVFMENGGSFDASKYRISLYLQLSDGGAYWVKPTYATPYADISEDGSFSIRYATGGTDQNAEVIHIMLIPSSYTPSSSFADTRTNALDYVKITRTSGGEITVSPNREPPDPPATEVRRSGLKANAVKLAVNVGFYTDGSAPGSRLSEELILRQLTAVSAFADTVRIYGAAGELNKAYYLAYDMGFDVIGTAWLNGNEANDSAELDALISLCNSGLLRVACVGSETLLRGEQTPQQIIEKLQYVKDRLQDASIPVTTADSIDILLEQPALRGACDILMPNCYPYWGGVSIEDAAESFARSVASLRAKAGGKEIVVSETGWPTAGQSIGKATPGEAEAARYFEEVRAWSVASGIPILWFDAADEPWKARDEGASGAHWGFLTKDMELKEGYADTDFFRAIDALVSGSRKYTLEKTAYTAGSVTVSLTNNTDAEASVRFVLAAYNRDGRLVGCKSASVGISVGQSTSLTVSYAEKETVTQVKAFVLAPETQSALREAWLRRFSYENRQ